MKFAALDIETANSDVSSICSMGIAIFDQTGVIYEWYSLINSGTHFDGINISIHGIEPDDVINAPRLRDVAIRIWRSLDGAVVVTHTHFDRTSIKKVSQNLGIEAPNCQWLDSSTVARRTWPSIGDRGYGLKDVCKIIGYKFDHHHALEDAKAAGQIIIAAMKLSGRSLGDIVRLASKQSNRGSENYKSRVSQAGNSSGEWAEETIVFTGDLRMLRNEAANLAASIGFNVSDSVTRKTTFLVVGGVNSADDFSGVSSSKIKKAELLLAAGQKINIITETEFREILASN